MEPVGKPGGVLLLGEWPTRDDEKIGRLGTGSGPVWYRNELRAALTAAGLDVPVAYATALACPAGSQVGKKFDPEPMLEACAGHLRRTLDDMAPTRIIAIGPTSVQALTGERLHTLWLRRSYCYIRVNGQRVPVFVMPNSRDLANKFHRKRAAADIRWAATAEPEPPPFDDTYDLVENSFDARRAVDWIARAPWSVFDCETAGRLWDTSFRALDVGITIQDKSTDSGLKTYVFGERALADAGCRAELARYLASPQLKVGANVKYDVNTVIASNVVTSVRAIAGDIRLTRKLIEPESSGALDQMAWLVGMGGTKKEQHEAEAEAKKWIATARRARDALAKAETKFWEDLDAGKKPKKKQLKTDAAAALARWLAFEKADPALAAYIEDPNSEFGSYAKAIVPAEVRDAYCARDCVSTSRAHILFAEELKERESIARIQREIVHPAQLAVQRIEQWGVQVSMPALDAFEAHCDTELRRIGAEIEQIAGPGFNADSWQQVGALLYDKLRLPTPRDGGRSTDAEALKEIADKHPVVGMILESRKFGKLQGTYARGMRPHVRASGRIHPSILLDGTRTGRASMENPNGQNIPRPDKREGVMARGIFCARPGRILVSLDYSQIELRIAAALSGDPVMNQIFCEGVDFHTRTAEYVSQLAWGIPPEAVEKRHRTGAKTINFGVLYGMSDAALARKMGCSVREATIVREAIMGRFSRLDSWIHDRKVEAQTTGYTWTHWGKGCQRGRRRALFDVASTDSKLASRAVNGAANTPVQGTASEFLTASLGAAVEWIQDAGLEDRVALILPVHDQLIFDVDKELLQRTINTAREIMLSWDSWGTPLEVDCEIGPNWGALKRVTYDAKDRAWVRGEE
jgi:DNA polymerase I-like protein with 3'-5' exonuclease and polymerase domains/uracil-DNA glycosylase